MPPGADPPVPDTVSSSGAYARSACRAAATSARGLELATTMTGAETNNLCATSAATTSGGPVRTDVADAGRRVRGARRTGAGRSCRAAPVSCRAAAEHDVVPTVTTASSASTAPARSGIPARPLSVRKRSTRHLGSTSAPHSSQALRYHTCGSVHLRIRGARHAHIDQAGANSGNFRLARDCDAAPHRAICLLPVRAVRPGRPPPRPICRLSRRGEPGAAGTEEVAVGQVIEDAPGLAETGRDLTDHGQVRGPDRGGG